jgi:CYTH domain-containing protein
VNIEIERKYLLSALPRLPQALEVLEIDQGYLPGLARLRHQRSSRGDERFFRTIKQGVGVRRLEFETEIDRAEFEKAWPETRGRRVHKRRHIVANGDDHWEIDEFLDRPLILAELEFDDPASAVTIPDWLRPVLVRDVTDEPEYTNRRLAR